jgi:secondary thiamine-phosphate synthase enzyme
MRMAQGRLVVETGGQGLYEVTAEIAAWVASQGISAGLLTLFLRHSSASILIQENAAPEVREDLLAFLRDLAPEEASRWRHQDEGPDDMPAHIKSALLPTQLAVPVAEARLLLGTWQGIYVVEHRRASHRRELVLHLVGE